MEGVFTLAPRSTRNKIRFQAKKASEDIDRAVGHLLQLNSIADGRHPICNDYMPIIVTLIEEMQKIITRFREQL